MNRKAIALVFACCVVRADAGDPFNFNMSLQMPNTPEQEQPFHVVFSAHTGPASGYMQTPSGGEPGTSDSKRPTLDELNISDLTYYDVAAYMSLGGRNSVYVGAEYIEESSSGTFAEPLVSRVAFPAGAPFDASVAFDWYRVGLQHSYDLSGPSLQFAPKIEFALLDFNYDLTSPGLSASRSYSKPAARVGADLTWRVSDAVGLAFEGSASIPYPDTAPMIATANGEIDVRVFDADGVQGTLFAGVGVLYMDYEDNQSMPNHIHLEVAPSYEAGFKAGW